MPGARIIFPEFRDEQSDSRYPFADTATLADKTGNVKISRTAIVDIVIYAIGGATGVYLSQIGVTKDIGKITIANGDGTTIATGEYSILSPPISGTIPLFDSRARPAGLIILTRRAFVLFSGWGEGTRTFTRAATEFVSSVVIPTPENCVRAISNGADGFFTGDVWLVGGNGVTVREVTSAVIRIDILGEPLFKRVLCDGPTTPFNPPVQLKTINNQKPDEYGNFTFTVMDETVADPVLRITPKNGSLQISVVGSRVD